MLFLVGNWDYRDYQNRKILAGRAPPRLWRQPLHTRLIQTRLVQHLVHPWISSSPFWTRRNSKLQRIPPPKHSKCFQSHHVLIHPRLLIDSVFVQQPIEFNRKSIFYLKSLQFFHWIWFSLVTSLITGDTSSSCRTMPFSVAISWSILIRFSKNGFWGDSFCIIWLTPSKWKHTLDVKIST